MMLATNLSQPARPTAFGALVPPDPAWLALQLPEEILFPDLPIVDAHHHLWEAPGSSALIVTTAVQFFESLFANRTSRCRKLHNLADAVTVDIAFGGMMYAIVDARELGFALESTKARDLVATGERIKAAAAVQCPATHPEDERIHTIN